MKEFGIVDARAALARDSGAMTDAPITRRHEPQARRGGGPPAPNRCSVPRTTPSTPLTINMPIACRNIAELLASTPDRCQRAAPVVVDR